MTTDLVTRQKNEIIEYLESGIAEIEKAASMKVNPVHIIRLVRTAMTKTPKLARCTKESISLALLTALQLGLEPDGYHAHFVPYENRKNGTFTCQLIPDYKGLVKLAYHAPNITGIYASAVYRNDDFDYSTGTGENYYIKHRPVFTNRGDLIAAYAIAKTDKGSDVFVVMPKEDIEKRKKVSPSSSYDDSPWKKWEAEMYAKTAIKSLAKIIPLGEKVQAIIEYENQLAAIDVEYKEKKRTSTLAELQQNQVESRPQEPPRIAPSRPSSAPQQGEVHVYDRILMLFDDLSYGEAARVDAYAEMGVKRIEELDETQANRFESILSKRLDDLSEKMG